MPGAPPPPGGRSQRPGQRGPGIGRHDPEAAERRQALAPVEPVGAVSVARENFDLMYPPCIRAGLLRCAGWPPPLRGARDERSGSDWTALRYPDVVHDPGGRDPNARQATWVTRVHRRRVQATGRARRHWRPRSCRRSRFARRPTPRPIWCCPTTSSPGSATRCRSQAGSPPWPAASTPAGHGPPATSTSRRRTRCASCRSLSSAASRPYRARCSAPSSCRASPWCSRAARR